MLSAEDRRRLASENLSYVRGLAAQIKERLPPEIEFEELVSYGTQGLLEAAERYDPSSGATFATYAYYRIRGAIFDGLRRMGWLSRTEYARHRAEEHANQYLAAVADRQASLARAGTEPPSDDLESNLQAMSDAMAGVAAIFVTSLDAIPETRRQTPDGTPGAEARLADAQAASRIKRAVDSLPEKERQLMQLYYYGEKTMQEAGAALGLSKSWASRLHARAIELLRSTLEEG